MLTNVAHEFVAEIGGGGEDAARDDIAFDLGKPEFDLIEPRRIGGREVNVHAGMIGQELLDACGFVSRKVVDDDVDLALARLLSQ